MEMPVGRMLGIFGVLGIVIGVGVAIAMDPKIKSEMIFAIACFIFSGVALSLTVGIWAFDTDLAPIKRALVAGPLFLIICISMVEASRWAEGRYHRATAATDRKGASADSDATEPHEAVEGQGPGTGAPKKQEAPPSSAENQSRQNDKDAHGTTDTSVKVDHTKAEAQTRSAPSGNPQPENLRMDEAFHEKLPDVVYFSLGEHGLKTGNPLKSLTEEKSTLIQLGGFVPVKFHLEKGVIYWAGGEEISR
jgi:hypothetical protein